MFAPNLQLLSRFSQGASGIPTRSNFAQDYVQTKGMGQQQRIAEDQNIRQQEMHDQTMLDVDANNNIRADLELELQHTEPNREKIAGMLALMGNPAMLQQLSKPAKALSGRDKSKLWDFSAGLMSTASTPEEWATQRQQVIDSYADNELYKQELERVVPMDFNQRDQLFRLSSRTKNAVNPVGFEQVDSFRSMADNARNSGRGLIDAGIFEKDPDLVAQGQKLIRDSVAYDKKAEDIQNALNAKGKPVQAPVADEDSEQYANSTWFTVNENGRPVMNEGKQISDANNLVQSAFDAQMDRYRAERLYQNKQKSEKRSADSKKEKDFDEVRNILKKDDSYLRIKMGIDNLYGWITSARKKWENGMKSGTAFTALKKDLGDAITGSDFANLAGRTGLEDLRAKLKNIGSDKLTDEEALRVVNSMVETYNSFNDDLSSLRESKSGNDTSGRNLPKEKYVGLVESVYAPLKRVELFSLGEQIETEGEWE